MKAERKMKVAAVLAAQVVETLALLLSRRDLLSCTPCGSISFIMLATWLRGIFT